MDKFNALTVGGKLKKALSAAAIAAMFVLSGCGAAEEPAAPASAATPTPTPATLTVDETCELLVGENFDGPFIKAQINIVSIDENPDWDSIRPLSKELHDMTNRAPDSMKALLEALVAPFDERIENTGSAGTMDKKPYHAAREEIEGTCAAHFDPGNEPEATEKRASTFETSGDKAADLKATGVEITGTPEQFLATMSIALCRDYELMKNGKESFGEIVKTLVDGTSKGDGAMMVRTVIAYKCPERAEEVEKHLD